jgi:aspartyl-tRNA(Asn)/glutamyl-tRNA(Gln) amidotransferase subunit C
VAEVDSEEIRALASLSRLSLSDDEVAAFVPQVSQILAYLQTLAEVEVEGVEPFIGPELPAIRLRSDDPASPFERGALLEGAAEHDGVHVLVPQFKEES